MKIKTWQIIVIVICLILGILLHYTYQWSGEKPIVGLFSAVNESTWEHLKLIFYPFLLMAIIGYFIIGKKSRNYWFAQAAGIFFAIAFTIIFFYTYKGILGENVDWVNISSFILAVIIGGYISYKILISTKIYNAELISIIFLVILIFSFSLYTFVPPQIALFRDPINGTYGIYTTKT